MGVRVPACPVGSFSQASATTCSRTFALWEKGRGGGTSWKRRSTADAGMEGGLASRGVCLAAALLTRTPPKKKSVPRRHVLDEHGDRVVHGVPGHHDDGGHWRDGAVAVPLRAGLYGPERWAVHGVLGRPSEAGGGLAAVR